jgi:hypothetical protein
MTLRLQPFIPQLVHSDQTGFIKGRCIAENFIYATEVVQCCHNEVFLQSSSSWISEKLLTRWIGMIWMLFFMLNGSLICGGPGSPASTTPVRLLLC